jgi:hypothetical protein
MKFSMTGQEKGDLLIQVTAWAGLTVHVLYITSITISNTCFSPLAILVSV